MSQIIDYSQENSVQVRMGGRLFKPADWGKRLGSLMIDGLISMPGYLLLILPGILLFGFRDSLRPNGASVGRNVMKQMLVDIDSGQIPSTGKRFARNLVALLLRSLTYGIYLIAEMAVSLSRKDGRCVTDLMFGTIVVEDPDALLITP
jgi:uncharacterized RDD family membrane protein YckC